MYFDLAAFFRYNYKAFFKTRGEHYRLTPKRILVLIIWLILYIPAQLINRFFFLMDEVFFWKYRQQEIKRPLFIIGNPRSGTTFLHRLMYKDTDTFTSFSVWELLFAPSITQRKIIWALASLIKSAGQPLFRILRAINKDLSNRDTAHKIRLNDAEEDEHVLIHSWSSETLWPLYPIKEELFPYFFFDRDIPYAQQERVMRFYRNMLQRHLYAHGGNRLFLSKNPSHTAKIAAITRWFPDARFIDLARNPFNTLPSMMDYMAAGWKLFCDPLEPYPHQQEFFEVMKFYYLYPVEYFQTRGESCCFIKYEELVEEPAGVVLDLYAWLQLEIPVVFLETLQKEVVKASSYTSPHQYSSHEMGISDENIFTEFEEVFSYYEFDTHHQELPDHVMLWRIKDWHQNWKSRRMQRKNKKRQRRQFHEENQEIHNTPLTGDSK